MRRAAHALNGAGTAKPFAKAPRQPAKNGMPELQACAPQPPDMKTAHRHGMASTAPGAPGAGPCNAKRCRAASGICTCQLCHRRQRPPQFCQPHFCPPCGLLAGCLLMCKSGACRTPLARCHSLLNSSHHPGASPPGALRGGPLAALWRPFASRHPFAPPPLQHTAANAFAPPRSAMAQLAQPPWGMHENRALRTSLFKTRSFFCSHRRLGAKPARHSTAQRDAALPAACPPCPAAFHVTPSSALLRRPRLPWRGLSALLRQHQTCSSSRIPAPVPHLPG